MTAIMQVLMAFVGALGFAVLFHVKGAKLVVCGLGGAISWIAYLAANSFIMDKVISLFAATLVVAILSEILARLIKAPAILFMVPMLIPLIPGSDLYYTTSYLFQNNMMEFGKNLSLFLQKAGAMAFGIILMASFVQIVTYSKNWIKSGKPSSNYSTPIE